MEKVIPISELSDKIFAKLLAELNIQKWNVNSEISRLFRQASTLFWDEVWEHVRRSRDNRLLGAPEYNGILLPAGTKFVFRRGHKTVFVIEQPPQVRLINFCRHLISYHSMWTPKRYEGPPKARFRLAFPYVIFIFVFDDDVQKKAINSERIMWSYFSDSPASSPTHLLYDNFLPNNAYGRICLPPMKAKYRRQKTYAGIVEVSIEHYWKSAFTDHDSELYKFRNIMQSSRGPHSLWEWERRTAKNPDFILKIHGQGEATIEQIVERFLDEVDDKTATKIIGAVQSAYNRERQEQLAKVDAYLTSLNLPIPFREILERELKQIAMNWEGTLLTMLKKGDKNNRRRRLIKRVREFFDKSLASAPTTKGGGK